MGARLTGGSGATRIARAVLLSLAALLAALGIPIIVRSSHRLGKRGEISLEIDEPDDDRPTEL